jgi:hypothetical protein
VKAAIRDTGPDRLPERVAIGNLTHTDSIGETHRFNEQKMQPAPIHYDAVNELTSVRCLKLKQTFGADTPCDSVFTTAAPDPGLGPIHLNIGTYPDFRDKECHSSGEYFCDPENLLGKYAPEIAIEMQHQREYTEVTCGKVEANLTDNDAVIHSRNFYVGVAIANEWPANLMDGDSLQRLGRVLFARWNLLPVYNGVDVGLGDLNDQVMSNNQYMSNCPNAAMLIILPKYRVAFVASPSCEFICMDRGGPEVVRVVLEAMGDGDSEGNIRPEDLAKAIKVGLDTVRRIIDGIPALSTQMMDGDKMTAAEMYKWERKVVKSESFMTVIQRVLLVAIVVGLLCVIGSAVAFQIMPSEGKGLRRAT